jgi:hypothetical protein
MMRGCESRWKWLRSLCGLLWIRYGTISFTHTHTHKSWNVLAVWAAVSSRRSQLLYPLWERCEVLFSLRALFVEPSWCSITVRTSQRSGKSLWNQKLLRLYLFVTVCFYRSGVCAARFRHTSFANV